MLAILEWLVQTVQSREVEMTSRLERETAQRRVGLAKEMMEARAKLQATGDTSAIEAELDMLTKKAFSPIRLVPEKNDKRVT